jgi:hypothetical protein
VRSGAATHFTVALRLTATLHVIHNETDHAYEIKQKKRGASWNFGVTRSVWEAAACGVGSARVGETKKDANARAPATRSCGYGRRRDGGACGEGEGSHDDNLCEEQVLLESVDVGEGKEREWEM